MNVERNNVGHAIIGERMWLMANEEIKDSGDIQTYLGVSGMKYNTKGQMYFEDSIYFTHWKVDNEILSSETIFNTLEPESFEAPMHFFEKGMDWNQFGFVQNFKDALTGEIASPLHRNIHLELYYVVQGTFRIRIQDQVLELKQGEVILLNSNALHSDTFNTSEMELVIMGLNKDYFNDTFHNSLEDESLSKFIKNSFDPSFKDAVYWTFSKAEKRSVLDTSSYRIQQELRHRSVHYEQMIQIYLTRLFKSLSNDFIVTKYQSEGHGLRAIIFTEVQRYIDSNYATVTLDQLADFMKYSRDYFNRLIKEITGLTYMQYLQKVKVEKAQVFLVETQLTVSEIAELVGYQNVTHFYDIFKTMTNKTPNEYRNERHIFIK